MYEWLEDVIWRKVTVPAHNHDGIRFHKYAPDDRDVLWLAVSVLLCLMSIGGAVLAFMRLPWYLGFAAAVLALTVCAAAAIAVKTMWACENRWQELHGPHRR